MLASLPPVLSLPFFFTAPKKGLLSPFAPHEFDIPAIERRLAWQCSPLSALRAKPHRPHRKKTPPHSTVPPPPHLISRPRDRSKPLAIISSDPIIRSSSPTVPPDRPYIVGHRKRAKAGEKLTLTCISEGGNPLPSLNWYRSEWYLFVGGCGGWSGGTGIAE